MNNTITPAYTDAVQKNQFQQKFILQTRNERGHIISLGTFERLITPEEAVQQFGPKDYTLKSVSPRFKVQWKHKQLKPETSIENGETDLHAEIGKLDRRTKAEHLRNRWPRHSDSCRVRPIALTVLKH